MLKAIHDLYSRGETFLDFFAYDLDDDIAWFNNSEFARFRNIDGHKILSILAMNKRRQSIDVNLAGNQDPVGISKSSCVLFCRAQEISHVEADQPLRVDGRLYTVIEASLLQDHVWRITLEAVRA